MITKITTDKTYDRNELGKITAEHEVQYVEEVFDDLFDDLLDEDELDPIVCEQCCAECCAECDAEADIDTAVTVEEIIELPNIKTILAAGAGLLAGFLLFRNRK